MSRATQSDRQCVQFRVPDIASLPFGGHRKLSCSMRNGLICTVFVYRSPHVGSVDRFHVVTVLAHQPKDEFFVDLLCTFHILSSNSKMSITCSPEENTRMGTTTCAQKMMAKWPDLLKPENGYVAGDGSILVEVEFAFNAKRISIFDNPNESDTSLIVGDRKFYADKYFLAGHSEFFRVLFFGEFADSHQKQLELFDVNPDNFLFFLRVLHYDEYLPPESSIGGILELGDRFGADAVIARCETLLMKDESKILLRLHYAEKYKMPMLQQKCLIQARTSDFKLIDCEKDDEQLKRFDEHTSSSVLRLLSDAALWTKVRDPCDSAKSIREAVKVPRNCLIM